ncbi:C-type lectin domain family 2 member H-like isoform X2 [Cricetulus griseus]|uniref:C-type lectin domain family 2 member H-like isoform X2 n=1 Tax=Cricetulus griseus TaxID=10029 RepID=A0A9J7H317_CRIGR|nr:C-type lectin domain family 2 member H-like isoform X2 [Cricetulus griseus]
MIAAKSEEASKGLLKTDLITPNSLQKVEIGKKLQGKCLRIIFTESPVKLYCCYGVIAVLTAAVLSLSVALSLENRRPVMGKCGPCYNTCPKDWIGFGSQCFYFSEDMRNWTFSQTSCMELEAHLAVFESIEELNFLKRYKGPSDHWIGLHRKSAEQDWMWPDNTQYNNMVPTRGDGECSYLSDIGISSARVYTHRKWICSKSKRHI